MTRIQHRMIRTIASGYICQDCGCEMQGEIRHEWRMQLNNHNSWHAGSFWTIHCDTCYIRNISDWQQSLVIEIDRHMKESIDNDE